MAARPAGNPLTIFLALYAGLVVFGSLYPFSGWASLGQWSAHFIAAPLPRYITRNDLTTNLLLYLPLGYGLTLWCLRRHWRDAAILVATLVGAAFSFGLESLQQLLPGRIASNLDVFINTLGALVGALAALHHGRWLRAWRAAYRWRAEWFKPHGPATWGLWLLLLWLFANFSLLPMPGAGWIDLHLRPIDMPPDRIGQINLPWFTATFLEMTAVGLFAATLLKPGRYASAIFLFFLATFALKLFAATLLLRLKVAGGILSLETLAAFLMAFWLLLLPAVSRHRRKVAIALLGLVALGRLLLMPSALWPTGSLLNIIGLANHIAALWPWLALIQLLHAAQRPRTEPPH